MSYIELLRVLKNERTRVDKKIVEQLRRMVVQTGPKKKLSAAIRNLTP